MANAQLGEEIDSVVTHRGMSRPSPLVLAESAPFPSPTRRYSSIRASITRSKQQFCWLSQWGVCVGGVVVV